MAMISQEKQQQQTSPHQGGGRAAPEMQVPHQEYTSLPSQDQWTTPQHSLSEQQHEPYHHQVVFDSSSCEHHNHRNFSTTTSQYHHQQQTWQQQQQQHHLMPQQQQQQAAMMMMQQRSNPIAIIRNPTENNNGNGVMTNEKLSSRSRSIDDSSDDESDTGVIDVEKDAKRLQRKYGAKVVVASTYQPSSESTLSKSILRAPYLGSLSRSENYLNLPPIRLSEPQTYDAGPPAEIGGGGTTTTSGSRRAGYGSLRDSQEKGRFLDGPASYREPRTGQLRPLNPRVRYKGVAPSNKTEPSTTTKTNLSIGERMQIAQQLKEKKRLEDEEKNSSNTKSSGEVNTATTTSSLSAMMDQAASKETKTEPTSTTARTSHNGKTHDNDDRWHPSGLVEGGISSGKMTSSSLELNEFGEIDNTRLQQHENPSDVVGGDLMMSTSLTAFEYLMSANKLYRTSAAAPATTGINNQRPAATFYQPGMMIPEHLVREAQFQPLSRSMSDPTPRLRSPRFGPRTTNLPPSMQMMQQPLGETAGGETMMLTTHASLLANGYFGAPPPGTNEQQPSVGASTLYNNTMTTPVDHQHLKAGEESSMMLPYGNYPAEKEHNPDTDYAFDMDE